MLLVTSALHMRRALALFKAQCLQVVPVAAYQPLLAAPGLAGWLPDAGAFHSSGRAFKKLIGQWLWLTTQF